MIALDIEGVCTENSDIRRVSSSIDTSGVSVILAAVGVVRGSSRVGGWFGITFAIDHTDAGAKSVRGVGVPFDAKLMRGVSEVPSLSMEQLCVAHLLRDLVLLLEDL